MGEIFEIRSFIELKTNDIKVDTSDHYMLYSVSQKKIPPYGFLKFFPKRLGILNQFFTHLLYYHFYTRLQIFIQISPTLDKVMPY